MRRKYETGSWVELRQAMAGASFVVLALVAPSLDAPLAAETLRQALAAAYQTSPRIDAERARLRATDEEVPRASAGYRPVIGGTANYGHQRSSSTPATSGAGASNPLGYQLSIRQSIFSGFTTTNAVREAEAGVRVGRETLRGVESDTLLDAVVAYMDVVREQAILKIREQNVAVLVRELQAAEVRRTVHEVTKTDVAQARARRARAVSAADLAKANLKIARARFEHIIGHAPTSVSEPPLRIKNMPQTIEEAIRAAEHEAPGVGTALYREQAARHAVDKVRGELLPQVTLEANYAYASDPSTSIEKQDTATVTGRVTVPFYEGGEVHARVRQAKHTHVSRLQEIEQVRSETVALVTAAWSRLVAARAQLKSDEIQVEASRTALEGVREEEKVGQRTLLDVLNAEQESLDAQVALVATRRDLVVASYALLATMGRLSSEAMGLTDQVYDPEEHYHATRQRWFGLDITRADGRREVISAVDRDNRPAE